MKTIKMFLTVLAGLCLLITCSKTDEFLSGDESSFTDVNKLKSTRDVTVPFKANFSVWDYSDLTDESCGGYPVFLLTMEGSGTITHLGKTSARMTFCCNVETGYYYNTTGIFVAANGDQLFFEIPEGQIVLNEEENSDYYQTRFNDTIIFTGGTGHFEGATGKALTRAYVHDGTDEWRTDFFSLGTLNLLKGTN